jgi:hypothetical protein
VVAVEGFQAGKENWIRKCIEFSMAAIGLGPPGVAEMKSGWRRVARKINIVNTTFVQRDKKYLTQPYHPIQSVLLQCTI